MKKIAWPTACRAEASATAYRTALDWPINHVEEQLKTKIKEKEEVLAEYNQQKQDRIHEHKPEEHTT